MEGRKCKTAGQLQTFCWKIEVLVQKLNHDTELLTKFDEVIQNQLKSGKIEMVTENTEERERRHYILHHAAIKPDINTIKVHVVDDALAKSKKSNLSLNECLHRVPIILENICGLLMRFRTRGIGIVADIENAFFSNWTSTKRKRNVTRFLRLKDTKKPPTPDKILFYCFTRIPFGIISSPFLLGATIKHYLEKEMIGILKDIYINNLITGVESKKAVSQL